jgi:hypothetical protein
MPLYTFLQNLMNVPVQIADKMALQKNVRVYLHGHITAESLTFLTGRDKSVGIPTGNGLTTEGGCTNVVQIRSVGHPASCTMGTAGSFPGRKNGLGLKLASHLQPVPKSS